MKKDLSILFFICFFLPAAAQIKIITNGKPNSRLVADTKSSDCRRAVMIFNYFMKKITGTEIPVVSPGVKGKTGDIILNSHDDKIPSEIASVISEDGFRIICDGKNCYIYGGEGSGVTNGTIALLEDFCGVRYYAANVYYYPQNQNIIFPLILDRTENPSFLYRQTQAYSMAQDSLYKIWFRLEQPNEIFASNYWVHTFDRLLPSKKYGKTHPEYYSFINGERRPGSASQWCLTNPELFDVVATRIDSIFKANPGKNIISISQNDGNFTNCQCDNCRRIDESEGSPSGTIIYFLNKLATRFPDKEFSTLAYLYSVEPPKNIKPLSNVNIMLCDIDCYREVPLSDNPSGRSFLKNLEGWSKISDNIFLWDYGINFDNYISPFPNFHILQANMQIFRKNNVKMHFSQIGSIKGGDFSELRSYVVSKLLWNIDYDVDSLIRSFLNGYYGKAGHFIYEYMKIQEGALLGSNIPLWIYDTPITHKTGMLNPNLIKTYRNLFDQAEKAVASDSILLKRVWQQRLSIQFAELEIARSGMLEDIDRIKNELDLFRHRAHLLGVTALNERNNTIDQYCDLYLKRNLPNPRKSLASNATITYTIPPNKPYDKIAGTALTDGLLGGATFNESWVGWEKVNGEFIIDLGEIKEIMTIEADFLHKLGSWILLPRSITCYTSTDGSSFVIMGKKDIAEDRSPEVKFVSFDITSPEKIKARYIKVHIENVGIGPSWHYGVGYPVWFFTDEIWVY